MIYDILTGLSHELEGFFFYVKIYAYIEIYEDVKKIQSIFYFINRP